MSASWKREVSLPSVTMRNSVGSSYVQIEYPSTDAAVLATAGVVRRVGNTAGPNPERPVIHHLLWTNSHRL